jgi:FtsH-binding integral membrane protein
MAEFDRPSVAARGGTAAVVDQGLRSYMLKVYNYMGIGLVVTGLVAYFTYMGATPDGYHLTSFGQAIYLSPLRWVVIFAPLAFVFALSYGVRKMSPAVVQILFWVFAAVMGVSLSSIFLVYTGASIAKVFFISAAMFGGMSLYGYTTKADLTKMGSFLVMGVWGLFIAMIVNLFWPSGALGFAISVIGVLIFLGLTAWNTQQVKESYNAGYGQDVLTKTAVMGALSLYLDFINIFLFLLRIFGNQRSLSARCRAALTWAATEMVAALFFERPDVRAELPQIRLVRCAGDHRHLSARRRNLGRDLRHRGAGRSRHGRKVRAHARARPSGDHRRGGGQNRRLCLCLDLPATPRLSLHRRGFDLPRARGAGQRPRQCPARPAHGGVQSLRLQADAGGDHRRAGQLHPPPRKARLPPDRPLRGAGLQVRPLARHRAPAARGVRRFRAKGY